MFCFVENATESTGGFRALPPRYHDTYQNIPKAFLFYFTSIMSLAANSQVHTANQLAKAFSAFFAAALISLSALDAKGAITLIASSDG